ncbi:hypothetical protein Nepgr_022068 [Nepenthes gracilis]|uniref:Pentatricopeptide repeat-containing protein n=1 Tax=Nepenthes gracilis TaxID=150966 RepID=A0AAD3T079_NEPGR|nr:hypothetical protein Nepgr_022068 [Nepenthes gracilis]
MLDVLNPFSRFFIIAAQLSSSSSLHLQYMQRFLGKSAIPCYTQETFSKSFASLSPLSSFRTTHECDSYLTDQHRHYLLSRLTKYASTRQVIQQIHSQLITSGLLQQSPETQIQVVNTVLRHYSLGQFPQEAVSLYKHVQRTTSSSRFFDSFTYSFLAKACCNLRQIVTGAQVHARVVEVGFGSHVYVQTALLNMYVVLGSLGDAKKVFEEMPERNLVTWNAMVTGLVKWGELETARALFDNMPIRNIISWTGMIDGLTWMNKYQEALYLFRRMVRTEGIMPTEITFLAIFPAIANLGDLPNCRAIHACGHTKGFNVGDVRFINCLIDAYAKCGCIDSASRAFEEMPASKRNLVSWASIISAFAMHGMTKQAVENFGIMKSIGLMPNPLTFLSIITACNHGGLVEEGLEFFRKMIDEHQLLPDIKHYGCVIDMLGRAGRLKEAEKMASEIPDDVDNVVIWRTLLGACSSHGDAEMAKRVTMKIREIERGYGGDYVLMSNILTGLGKFGDAETLRASMDERFISKVPGVSLIYQKESNSRNE